MSQPVAVVTGASSGIGAATARALGAAGWTAVLVARGKPQLEVVQQSIKAAGGTAVIAALDATDGDQVVALVERTGRELGPPSLVVNSAGIGALIGARAAVVNRGNGFFLVSPTEAVKEVLNVMGVQELFQVKGTLQEVIETVES